jgi:large subunit ribosomal protein L25
MEINVTLNASVRSETGKGPVGRLRRKGSVPGVFYGRGKPAQMLSLDYKELKTTIFEGAGASSVFMLRVKDRDDIIEKIATIKDYQFDPIKRTVIHADFQEVDMNRPIQFEIPLVLIGEPIGVERGGMLQQIRRELTVQALPTNMPETIEVDVSHMDVGDSLHVEAVKTGEGVELVYDVNFTLATLSMPRAEAEGEETETIAEGGEPEGVPGTES